MRSQISVTPVRGKICSEGLVLLHLQLSSPPPLSVLWVCTRQADGNGGRCSHVVSLHHLSAHLHLHQSRVDESRQQSDDWLHRFREETGKGKVVRHVPPAPAVPLVEAQVHPARQGAITERSEGGGAVEESGQAEQGQEEEDQRWSSF